MKGRWLPITLRPAAGRLSTREGAGRHGPTLRFLANAAALCLAWAAMGAKAQELLAVGTSFPRLFMPAAGGAVEGLAVDLLQAVAQQRGWQLRFEIYPWPRAQAMVEHGQAQILIGPYRTPERELRFSFTASAFYEDHLVFFGGPAPRPLWQGDYRALVGLEIAQVAGWAYGEAFEQARPLLRLTTVRDVETGLRMLRAGRVALLATNERNTQPVLASLGLQQQLTPVEGPPIGHLRGHFACPRQPPGPALCEALDQALLQLRRNGDWPRLNQKWGVGLPEAEGTGSAWWRQPARSLKP